MKSWNHIDEVQLLTYQDLEGDPMKKLMTLMLGLTLAIGCVAVTFAQDTTKQDDSGKKKGKKKKKDGDDTTKAH